MYKSGAAENQRKGRIELLKKMYACKRTDGFVFCAVTVLFLAECVGVLALPNAAVNGAARGLSYSFGVLVPSLFPFMFLSNFAAEYGISQALGRSLEYATEKLFNLPGESGVTILLSLIGGFPVGAGGINVLKKQGVITNEQAVRMLMFCVNSGPAFLISVVGAQLYGSVKAGVVLLTGQTAASLSIGFFTSRRAVPAECEVWSVKCGVKSDGNNSSTTDTSHVNSTLEQKSIENSKAFGSAHNENRHTESNSSESESYSKSTDSGTTSNFTLHTPHSTLGLVLSVPRSFSTAFVLSCKSACTSVINMCALVVLFSAFVDIGCAVFSVSEGSAAYCVITSLFEVTTGCAQCAACRLPIYIASAVVGWGGISVHFQVFSAAEHVNINKPMFFAARTANALLSGVYTFIGVLLLGGSAEVFSTAEETAAGFPYGTAQGSVALFVASVLFLMFIHSYIFFSDKKNTRK